MDKAWLRSFILTMVKPLKSGKIVSTDDKSATMKDLYPEGQSSAFRYTSPFGFISKVPAGVTGFYNALFGSGHESILMAMIHALRPTPSAPGETILYSTNSEGNQIRVKITLQNDGTIVIDSPVNVNINCQSATIAASTKTTINSPLVDIGSGALEKVVNGETFKTFFNLHTHTGNLGYPTTPPDVPMDDSHLSAKVKAAK